MALSETERSTLWKERFHALTLLGARLAEHRRDRGLVVSQAEGVFQLFAWDLETGSLRQLTNLPSGLWAGEIAANGEHVYYVADVAGSETGHYLRVPWEGGDPIDVTPDLTPYAAIYRAAENGAGTVFAFTPTEESGFPLYVIDIAPDGTVGPPRELYRSPKLIDDACLTFDGSLAAIATTERATARQYEVLVFETATGQRVGELSILPRGSVRAAMFSPLPGDSLLLMTEDGSGAIRPFLWDPHSGARRELDLGDLTGDVEPMDWWLDGQTLLLRQTYQAQHQLYRYDLDADRITRLEHPSGTYMTAQFRSPDHIAALWTDATHIAQVVELDATTGALLGTLLAVGDNPPARTARSVTFQSSDGETIQGWLGLPDGEPPFPAVLSVHGGPLIAVLDGYDPEAQAWLDQGFAFLSINYRGSTTFGREFKEKIWGDMGHWEVEDMAAAHDWLVQQGIARRDQIFVTGASYGGYLTLMAMGKQPDLWAGGMAVVAEADLVTSYRDGTDWSRGYLRAMMGGTPEEKPEQYAASSPITYADRVQAPLLVIQGRTDMRCPPRQMERYAARMDDLRKPFTIEWFDAGHAGITIDHFIGFQERMMQFAKDVLETTAGTRTAPPR